MEWILHCDDDVYDCSNQECPIKFSQTVRYSAAILNPSFSDGQLRYFSCQVDGEPVVVDYRFIDNGKVYIRPEYLFGTFIGGVFNSKKAKAITDRIRTWILFS